MTSVDVLKGLMDHLADVYDANYNDEDVRPVVRDCMDIIGDAIFELEGSE